MLSLIEKFWGTISSIKKKMHVLPPSALIICVHGPKRQDTARHKLGFFDSPKQTALF